MKTPSAMLVCPVFFAATLPGEPEGEQGLRGGRARSIWRGMYEAVIFDCDGVLVDTEVLALDVEGAVLAEFGVVPERSAYMARFMGLDERPPRKPPRRPKPLPRSQPPRRPPPQPRRSAVPMRHCRVAATPSPARAS